MTTTLIFHAISSENVRTAHTPKTPIWDILPLTFEYYNLTVYILSFCGINNSENTLKKKNVSCRHLCDPMSLHVVHFDSEQSYFTFRFFLQ